MKNIQNLMTVLCLLGISACAIRRNEPLNTYQGSTLSFRETDILGWRYDLVSDTRTFSIRFAEAGYAPATIGSKDILAAPAYRWKIDENHSLAISDDEGLVATYQLISMTDDTATVWDKVAGETKMFTRKKNPRMRTSRVMQPLPAAVFR